MNGRIEVVEKNSLETFGLKGEIIIVRDRQTGVLYMHSNIGSSSGLIPMVDVDGKPLVIIKCPECDFEIKKGMMCCPECGYPME